MNNVHDNVTSVFPSFSPAYKLFPNTYEEYLSVAVSVKCYVLLLEKRQVRVSSNTCLTYFWILFADFSATVFFWYFKNNKQKAILKIPLFLKTRFLEELMLFLLALK